MDGRGRFRRLMKGGSTTSRSCGVTAIWVLPFYPSPLRDDGYDIADFKAFNPSNGPRLKDFPCLSWPKRIGCGLRVINRLVHQPHSPTSPPGSRRAPRRQAGLGQRAATMSGARPTPSSPRPASSSSDTRRPPIGTWDPVAEEFFLASLLFSPAGPEFRTIPRS